MIVKRVHGVELNLLKNFIRTKPKHINHPFHIESNLAYFKLFTVLADARFNVLK